MRNLKEVRSIKAGTSLVIKKTLKEQDLLNTNLSGPRYKSGELNEYEMFVLKNTGKKVLVKESTLESPGFYRIYIPNNGGRLILMNEDEVMVSLRKLTSKDDQSPVVENGGVTSIGSSQYDGIRSSGTSTSTHTGNSSGRY